MIWKSLGGQSQVSLWGTVCLSGQYHCQHIRSLVIFVCSSTVQTKKKWLQTIFSFSPGRLNTSHRCKVCISSSTNGSQDVCLFCVCLCICKHVAPCSPSVRVGRQVEHPFCCHCCPFHFTLRELRVNPLPWAHYQCCSRNKHPTRMQGKNQIIIPVWGSEQTPWFFCLVYITFPSEISK